MKPSLTRPTLVSVVLISTVGANPKSLDEVEAVGTIEKSWERCIVNIDETSAHVSCAVGYHTDNLERRTDQPFTVPVFWPAGKMTDLEQATRFIAPRLECNNVIYTFNSIEFEGEVFVPTDDGLISQGQQFLPPLDSEKDAADKATINYSFQVDLPERDRFSMVVSYNQPLISAIAYYLPLFVSAPRSDEDKNGFFITMIPAGLSELKLLSAHQYGVEECRTQVSIRPRHEELIAVKIQPSGQAGTEQLPASPESKTEGDSGTQSEQEGRSR